MNKKIITTTILLVCLLFMPISAKADYPTGELGYSDDIATGNDYEWTVAKLAMTGDFASYTDFYTVGGETLTQGSKIKITITDDPDTAVGDWYEIYLDGVLIPGADLGGLAYYAYGGFFISPVTYTNATGTYNIYEQLLEEIVDENVNTGDSGSTEYSGYTVEYTYSEIVEFAIKGDVFVVYMYRLASVTLSGGGYDESMFMEMSSETTVNINTGLIGKIEMKSDVDMTIYTSSVVGTAHILIDSGYAKTPYNWAFSFLGLTVIAAVVALAKRKR